jgi:hypothetical protein
MEAWYYSPCMNDPPAGGSHGRLHRTTKILLGGAAAWPLAARAQQPERMRRIDVLMPATADDPDFQARVGAFLQGLQQSGWSIGRNVRIDTRWATANVAEIRRHAAELTADAPDIILAHGASAVGPLLQATRTVPVVFPVIGDPVAAGFVDSLARPGGNATGFMSYEYSLSGKWLELLKEIAPRVTRVAVLRDVSTPTGALGIRAHVLRRHQASVVSQYPQLAAEMMRPDASLHADETRRQVGQPCFHLPARPLLPKHDRPALVVTHHVKRVLADIDTDHSDCGIDLE